MTVTLPEARDGSEFTHYNGCSIEYRDASHRYWLHVGDQRTPAVSVTSVLKVIAKDALIGWAEDCGAQGAAKLARLGELDGVPLEDVVARVRMHGLGADAKRDEGAGRGTAVHDVLSTYASTGSLPSLSAFDPQHRGYVQGLCRWLLQAKPEPTAVEIVVGSPTHGFAGRMDLRALIDGRDLIVDLKTNRGGRCYDEPHLQCAAYRLAHVECGAPEPDGGLIVAVGEDGSFEQTECEAAPEDFLSVLAVHQAMGRLRRSRQARERAAKKASA